MDTTASHSGQFFFDQALLAQVEATSPYSTNTQNGLTNEEDTILAAYLYAEGGVDSSETYVPPGLTGTAIPTLTGF